MVALCIAACSGDNGTEPGGGGGGGGGGEGAVTHADTIWVQDVLAFAAQLDQWAGESPDTIAARSLAYLLAMSSVQEAGITDGTTVWANFTSGFDLIIPNNRSTSTQADTLVDALALSLLRGAEAPRRITVPSGRAATKVLAQPKTALELPVPATFRAINAIGTCHVNPLPVIRSLLKEGNYTEDSPGPGTVSRLKTVNGDGVFYINSHGGPGYDPNQQPYYAIWTADPIDVATLGNYKRMVDRHELVGMLETSNDALGNCAKVLHYGFTAKFVRKYMKFPQHSLVIVDACSSASAPAADLRQAFADAGASVYVGWSRVVNAQFAYAAMKYLIDRLLGINKISPEFPKQRAFNIDDVHKDMEDNRDLVTDPYRSAVLMVSKLKGDFGLLAPSIQFLSVEEEPDQSVLIVAGMFGTDPGPAGRSVKINGQSLDVIEWDPYQIRCDLPQSGANSAGTVVVEVGSGANPRVSNPVNITEWSGDLTYERQDPGDQHLQMRLKVRFRADVHSFRDQPHEPPFETIVLFGTMHDASVSITTGGSYSQVQGNCTDTFAFGGSVSFPSPYETTQDGGWDYYGSVDTQNRELQLNMYLFALFGGSTWTRSGPPECGPFTTPMWISVTIEDCLFDDVAGPGLKAFLMGMNPDFSVPADNRGPWTVPPNMSPLMGLTGEVSMRWDAMTSNHPPDPDAAR